MDYSSLISAFGGLSIFLLGMKYMSEGIQTTAGKRLRSMIGAVTDHRLAGCCTGAVVTFLIQSSSITTVMLVGLVNASVMTLKQAFGVILGANIGTTVTGWIVGLNVIEYGLPVMSLAVFAYLFAKAEKLKTFSMIVMGVGMVFYGLMLMKDGVGSNSQFFSNWVTGLTTGTAWGLVKCVLIGAAATAIIQSSSATVAITITLASTKIIGLSEAVALVLGENIGTTVTAAIATIGASVSARRVALAHILSKVIGVVLLLFVFEFFMDFLNVLMGAFRISRVEFQIAFAHTLFNVILVIIFLLAMKPFLAMIEFLMPVKGETSGKRVSYLDVRMLGSPTFGVQQSLQELIRMADKTQTMMNELRVCLMDEENGQSENSIFEGEKLLDDHQKELVLFLTQMMRGNITTELAAETRKQIRIADEYESVSDYVTVILKLILRRKQAGYKFSEKAIDELLQMHDKVAAYLALITHELRRDNASRDILVRIYAEDSSITHLYKDQRQQHLARIEKGDCEALPGMIYADMMQAYRKIKDHALNIAEAIAGDK